MTELTTTTSTGLATNEPKISIIDSLLAQIGARAVKQVTRTVLQQADGVPFAVHIEAAAIESEVQNDKSKMEPARVCDVINVATGAHQLLIMNTVLEGELDRNYPKLDYVGRTFLVRGYRPVDAEGKQRRYKVYEIIEIEVDGFAGKIHAKEVVADGTEPVNRKGKPIQGDKE